MFHCIVSWFLCVCVGVCVCLRMTERKRYSQKKKKRERKKIVTKPFPLQEHDYFLRVGTRNGRANPSCYRGTGAWNFHLLLKFFFPRFHHAECIMLTNQGGPVGVEAAHHNNTNIRIYFLLSTNSLQNCPVRNVVSKRLTLFLCFQSFHLSSLACLIPTFNTEEICHYFCCIILCLSICFWLLWEG